MPEVFGDSNEDGSPPHPHSTTDRCDKAVVGGAALHSRMLGFHGAMLKSIRSRVWFKV